VPSTADFEDLRKGTTDVFEAVEAMGMSTGREPLLRRDGLARLPVIQEHSDTFREVRSANDLALPRPHFYAQPCCWFGLRFDTEERDHIWSKGPLGLFPGVRWS
jgi:hypothetical protein